MSIQSLFMCIGKHAELLFKSLGAISKSRIAKTDFKKSPAIYFKWKPTLYGARFSHFKHYKIRNIGLVCLDFKKIKSTENIFIS